MVKKGKNEGEGVIRWHSYNVNNIGSSFEMNIFTRVRYKENELKSYQRSIEKVSKRDFRAP